MKRDLQDLERGFDDGLEKDAFLGGLYDSTIGRAARGAGRALDDGKAAVGNLPGFKQYNQVSKGLNYVTGGGLMNDLGTAATSAIPLLGMFGGGKSGAGGGAAPNININLGGNSNPLGIQPGSVQSFGTASTQGIKTGGLLDLNLLRTVLTARTANDMIDSVHADKTNPENAAIPNAPANPQLELTTKYPEMEKILADPQSRAYLESLLTNKTGYGT